MKKFFANIFLSLIAFGIISSFASAKEYYNIVLFYADWNVYSNQSISVFEEVTANLKDVTLDKINIDDKKAFFKIKEFGVMPINKIPFYFLLDKHQKVIYGSAYNNESAKEITAILNKKISEN